MATTGHEGVLTIVGAGPGVGRAVAQRFGREGYRIGLVSRGRERLEALVDELAAGGVHAVAASADIRCVDELRAAMRDLADRLGSTQVLCFSPLPDVSLIKAVTETSAEEFAAALELNVVGAAAAVGEVLPDMRTRGQGTLLFTTGGAALTPSARRATSGVTYGAQTVYLTMLHEALAPESIHVAQTVIVGPIGPGEQHEPDTVAEHLWRRHVDRDDALTVIR